jgi:hypothetical protein
MSKYLVDLWIDGYNTEEEMEDACEEFLYEQLNMTASSVKIEKCSDDVLDEEMEGIIEELERYIKLSDDEVSESCKHLIILWSYRSYLSGELLNYVNNYVISTKVEKKTIETKYDYLEERE